jgi:ABC-type enterochelin transport system substrate-binding protein
MADAARRERQDAVLAELSELGPTLARELHARALAAETPQDAEKLALAFQRVSRGVRQTFALELKFERDRTRTSARPSDRPGCAPSIRL